MMARVHVDMLTSKIVVLRAARGQNIKFARSGVTAWGMGKRTEIAQLSKSLFLQSAWELHAV